MWHSTPPPSGLTFPLSWPDHLVSFGLFLNLMIDDDATSQAMEDSQIEVYMSAKSPKIRFSSKERVLFSVCSCGPVAENGSCKSFKPLR